MQIQKVKWTKKLLALFRGILLFFFNVSPKLWSLIPLCTYIESCFHIYHVFHKISKSFRSLTLALQWHGSFLNMILVLLFNLFFFLNLSYLYPNCTIRYDIEDDEFGSLSVFLALSKSACCKKYIKNWIASFHLFVRSHIHIYYIITAHTKHPLWHNITWSHAIIVSLQTLTSISFSNCYLTPLLNRGQHRSVTVTVHLHITSALLFSAWCVSVSCLHALVSLDNLTWTYCTDIALIFRRAISYIV